MTSLDNKTIALYRCVFLAMFPVIVLYTVYRAVKDGGLTYFLQRLGFAESEISNPLWFHCASVGEINTAGALIEKFRKSFPHLPILISTTTPTGKRLLLDKKIENCRHAYFPLDYSFAVNRFLQIHKPQALLVMETEIWPEMFLRAGQTRIPVILFNARLSNKTLGSYKWLLNTYGSSLRSVLAVLAKSENEKNKFLQLGMDKQKLQVVGSLKFSNQKPTISGNKSFINRPYWLAASTHDDEELRLCREWIDRERSELLVIAPRHPERRHKIVQQLKTVTPSVQLRSHVPVPHPTTKVYLLDTLGEMSAFMAHAKLVFMGGSLVPIGGHNLIEPALLGVTVITGPYMHNFEDECALLQSHSALTKIINEKELMDRVCILLDNAERRHSLAVKAKQLCESQTGVADRYFGKIMELLDLDTRPKRHISVGTGKY